jgi:DNA-binding response OmpR family regulator
MDRVLIAIDQIQYASHLEMTLRKVGFDVEVIANEFNLSEKLLTFNPDMIIVRGQSAKLSAFNVGKKLKDHLKYSGRVIIILGQDQKISPEDLTKIRMDLLLFEPLGVLKLVMNILNLDPARKEMMQDRLLRMAETDSAFRSQEQSYLVSHGQDLDRELIQVQGKISDDDQDLLISDEVLEGFDSRHVQTKKAEPETLSSEYKQNLQAELAAGRDELSLRIDTYNHQIKKLDQDLKKGLNKRQTKSVLKKQRAELMVDPGQEKLDSLDQEKRKFAQAMFRKK